MKSLFLIWVMDTNVVLGLSLYPTDLICVDDVMRVANYQITSTNLEHEIIGSFVISLAPAFSAVPAMIRSCNVDIVPYNP